MFAPLIVFAYNRSNHLRQSLTALTKNKEASESELFIFIDGPKTIKDLDNHKAVCAVAESFKQGCFKNTEIIISKINKGLAASVIGGVSTIIKKYGKVIVTEDDAVSSPYYLKFMNEALDYYKDNNKIWSIGGYTVPLQIPKNYDKDIFFTQRSSSYSWATWKDRWSKIDWEMKDYWKFHFDFCKRARFNRWGVDRSAMLDDQMKGRIDSWAIRFDYNMFKNHSYNVLPIYSLINNIGHDGSGTHSVVKSTNDPFKVDLTKAKQKHEFCDCVIDDSIRTAYSVFFTESRLSLLKRFIKNIL